MASSRGITVGRRGCFRRSAISALRDLPARKSRAWPVCHDPAGVDPEATFCCSSISSTRYLSRNFSKTSSRSIVQSTRITEGSTMMCWPEHRTNRPLTWRSETEGLEEYEDGSIGGAKVQQAESRQRRNKVQGEILERCLPLERPNETICARCIVGSGANQQRYL
jgi:hypothetical protein